MSATLSGAQFLLSVSKSESARPSENWARAWAALKISCMSASAVNFAERTNNVNFLKGITNYNVLTKFWNLWCKYRFNSTIFYHSCTQSNKDCSIIIRSLKMAKSSMLRRKNNFLIHECHSSTFFPHLLNDKNVKNSFIVYLPFLKKIVTMV